MHRYGLFNRLQSHQQAAVNDAKPRGRKPGKDTGCNLIKSRKIPGAQEELYKDSNRQLHNAGSVIFIQIREFSKHIVQYDLAMHNLYKSM